MEKRPMADDQDPYADEKNLEEALRGLIDGIRIGDTAAQARKKILELAAFVKNGQI